MTESKLVKYYGNADAADQTVFVQWSAVLNALTGCSGLKFREKLDYKADAQTTLEAKSVRFRAGKYAFML